MVNHHLSPPFGRKCFSFSQHLKQIQDEYWSGDVTPRMQSSPGLHARDGMATPWKISSTHTRWAPASGCKFGKCSGHPAQGAWQTLLYNTILELPECEAKKKLAKQVRQGSCLSRDSPKPSKGKAC